MGLDIRPGETSGEGQTPIVADSSQLYVVDALTTDLTAGSLCRGYLAVSGAITIG